MQKKPNGFSPNDIAAVLTLIVGVAIATLVLIFTGSLGGQTYQLVEPDLASIGTIETVTNENFIGIVAVEVSLDNPYIQTGEVVYNTSNAAVIATGNYTINYTTGTFQLDTAAYNGTNFSINYSYRNTSIEGYIKDSILAGFKAQKTTGTYLPLIVLAAVIGLVLSMVLGIGGGVAAGGFRGGAL